MAYKKYWYRVEIMITHYLVKVESDNSKNLPDYYSPQALLEIYTSPPRSLEGVEIHDNYIFKVPANKIELFQKMRLFNGGVRVKYTILKEISDIIEKPANKQVTRIEEAVRAMRAKKEAIAGERAAREAAFLTMLASKNNMTERESTIVREFGEAYKQMEQYAENAESLAENAESLAKNAMAGRFVNSRGSPSADEVERNKKNAEDLISKIRSAPDNVKQYFRGGELIRPIEEVMERVYLATTRAQVAIDQQNKAKIEERKKKEMEEAALHRGLKESLDHFVRGGRRRTHRTRRVKRKGTKAKKSRKSRR